MDISVQTAASYARISEKVERDKVADQHRQNAEHARVRGYTIVAQYTDDGISALGHKVRQGFRDMLAAAERGEFQVIIATEEERLARNVGEKLELHAACATAGVTWDTARDGFVDPETDSGEFMSTIRAAMGRIESKRKARRQLAANAARIQDGLPVPGKTRFGYKRGNIELVPAEAEKVKALFDGFLSGASIRSMSIAMGWRAERVRETLSNPAYAGYVVRHGERYEAHSSVGRIIDRDAFEAVQSLLAAPGRRTTPGSAPRHLLSGLAHCGVCGNPMVYRNNYLCLRDLSHPCIKGEMLDNVVKAEVLRVLLLDRVSELPESSRLREIDRRQIAIEVARGELLSAIEFGAKASDIGPGIQRLDTENDALSAERDRIVSASVTLAIIHGLRARVFSGGRASIDAAAEVKNELGRRFDALSLKQRRDLVRGIVSVTVHKGRGTGRVELVAR